MKIDIPKNNNWTQFNRGDIYGTVWSSFCIDFDKNEGKVNISPRTIDVVNSTDVASITGVPTAFQYWNSRYYFTAGGRVFVSTTNNPTSTFTADSDTGHPTDLTSSDSDLIVFNNKLYTMSSNIYAKSGSTWSTVSTAPTTTPHLMTVYANRLYFTESYTEVWSLNTSDVVSTSGSNTIDITSDENNDLIISCITSNIDGIWIGTVNEGTGKAEVILWDGETSNQSIARYKVDAKAIWSIIIYEDRPYIFDSEGKLSVFNGKYFQEVARLPLDRQYLRGLNEDDNDERPMHPNGMTIINDRIHLLISNRPQDETNDTHSERWGSGVWCYDQNIGLYHKYSISQYTDSVTDYGSWHLQTVGALSAVLENRLSDVGARATFFAGVEYFTDATTSRYAVVRDDYEDTIIKNGFLVTTEIQSPEITENWEKLYLIYDKFANTSDKIVVKARSTREDDTEATITWTSTTTFTSTDDLSGVSVGNEVFVTRGKGAGNLAHVSAIEEAGGTYTVTLDETITGASGTAKVKINNWVKIGTIEDTAGYTSTVASGQNGVFVQYKLYFIGKGDSPQLHRLVSVSNSDILGT